MTSTKRLALLFAGLPALLSGAARAVESEDAKTYNQCMDQARENPDKGFGTASVWLDHGGGLAAEHCVAMALIGLKQYGEAAKRLETLATEMVREPAGMRAEVLSQAAEAWSEEGSPQDAEAALSEAIKLAPDDPDYPVNRAVARAARKDYHGAVEDLTKAIQLGGPRGDALAYRAAAWRYLGDLKQAQSDADQAVAVAPTLPEAWLERANVRRLGGDLPGARKDWLRVLQLAPDSPAADAARDNIAEVDIHSDKN